MLLIWSKATARCLLLATVFTCIIKSGRKAFALARRPTSFVENRRDYILGEPTKRLPGPIDAGIMGMREGGWRRIYAPDAFGDVELRKQSFGPQGRYTGAKAPLLIQPHAPAYVDIIMLDGGAGGASDFCGRPA